MNRLQIITQFSAVYGNGIKTNNPLSNNRVTSRREKIIHKTEQKLN